MMSLNAEGRNMAKLHELESELGRLQKDARVIERLINEFHDMRRSGTSNDRLRRKIKTTEDELDVVKKEIAKISRKICSMKIRTE